MSEIKFKCLDENTDTETYLMCYNQRREFLVFKDVKYFIFDGAVVSGTINTSQYHSPRFGKLVDGCWICSKDLGKLLNE